MPKAAGKDKEMDGVEKAAILLIALGPQTPAAYQHRPRKWY